MTSWGVIDLEFELRIEAEKVLGFPIPMALLGKRIGQQW
jgi:hypothetical protein